MMAPVWASLKEKYAERITFIEVTVSDEEESGRQLAGEYRVNSSPTYLFLHHDGYVVGQLVGRQPQADMEAALDLLLSR